MSSIDQTEQIDEIDENKIEIEGVGTGVDTGTGTAKQSIARYTVGAGKLKAKMKLMVPKVIDKAVTRKELRPCQRGCLEAMDG